MKQELLCCRQCGGTPVRAVYDGGPQFPLRHYIVCMACGRRTETHYEDAAYPQDTEWNDAQKVEHAETSTWDEFPKEPSGNVRMFHVSSTENTTTNGTWKNYPEERPEQGTYVHLSSGSRGIGMTGRVTATIDGLCAVMRDGGPLVTIEPGDMWTLAPEPETPKTTEYGADVT